MENFTRRQTSILDNVELQESKYISVYEYERILIEDYSLCLTSIRLRLQRVALALPHERNDIMQEDLSGLEQDRVFSAEMSMFTYDLLCGK